jgi:uncharacterized protein with HEPN domain
MTRRSPRKRLEHARDACEFIRSATAGKTFEEYDANVILKSAVERQFTILGEALRAAEHIEPTIPNSITAFRQIIDFRNVLVHDYATVFPEGIWDIIHRHLPRLRTEVEALLQKY